MRDSNGIFMAASAHWMDSLGSALLAEAEAFRDGVLLIPHCTMEHILVEINSHARTGLAVEE